MNKKAFYYKSKVGKPQRHARKQYVESSNQKKLVNLLRIFNYHLEFTFDEDDIKFNACMTGVPLRAPQKMQGVIRHNMYAYGAEKGHPDIMIYLKACIKGVEYSGLALELKTETGRVSVEQKHFLEVLEKNGWKTGVPRTDYETLHAAFDYISHSYKYAQYGMGIVESLENKGFINQL